MTRSVLMVCFATFLAIFSAGGCARDIDKDLVHAAYVGDIHQIEGLLDSRGANPNKIAVDGWNALSIASREGHVEAVQVLLHSGARIDDPEGGGNTALFWAAFYDHLDVIRLLVTQGADVNKKGKDGETPLHVALRLGHLEAGAVLREAGAKDNRSGRAVKPDQRAVRPDREA